MLLLAQAGAPFTTGLWAKLQVVFAAVEAGEVPLAVIAMVTAAVAAYFYLRVAVLMYAGGGLGEPEGGTGGSAELGAGGGMIGGAPHRRRGRTECATTGPAAGWPGPPRPRPPASVTDAQRADPAGRRGGRRRGRAPRRVPVPALSGLAIALCTGVTVLFGVWPQPLIDFANHATLLFLPN